MCPVPVDNQYLISRLVDTLAEWNKGGGPDKFVFMLEHKYSQVSPSFLNPSISTVLLDIQIHVLSPLFYNFNKKFRRD